MKRLSQVTAICLSLAGCGKAQALVPDASNPEHCVVAINFAGYWIHKAGDPQMILESKVRLLFEMKKMQVAGYAVNGPTANQRALTREYGHANDKTMNKLVEDCISAEQRDPKFHAAIPYLEKAAEQMKDPWTE